MHANRRRYERSNACLPALLSSLKSSFRAFGGAAAHPALLMVASAALARFAALVAPSRAAVDQGSIDPRFEFHADAGVALVWHPGRMEIKQSRPGGEARCGTSHFSKVRSRRSHAMA